MMSYNKQRWDITAEDFMRRYGMHFDCIDLNLCIPPYLEEMEYGLNNTEGILSMLPTFVKLRSHRHLSAPFIVMDIGGTNIRIAMASFDSQGRCSIHNIRKIKMPGTNKIITSDEFYDTVAHELIDFTNETKNIYVSFADEMNITPEYDGKIIAMSKEIRIKGIGNGFFGANLKMKLNKAYGLKDCHIRVINDTVAAALSGIADKPDLIYDSYIGLIVGTGTNTSYVEQNRKIGKLTGAPEGSMFINVESGNYTKQPRGVIDEIFDQTTMNPSVSTLEKMVSGRYIGELFYNVVKAAVKEGLFSNKFEMSFSGLKVTTTKDLSAFARSPFGHGAYAMLCSTEKDRDTLCTLAAILIRRAAKLIVLEVACAAIKSCAGKEKEQHVCVVAEGTTIKRLPGLKTYVQKELTDWLYQKMKIHTSLIEVENCILKGAAVFGLNYRCSEPNT